MKKIVVTYFCLLFSFAYANANQNLEENPFATPSTLPFEAPPFDKIKNSDYLPAFLEGMKQKLIEIEKIANNTDAPTFENTIVAMEKSGQMLNRVSSAFFAVAAANTNDELDKIETEVAPKLSANDDLIHLNSKLFARIKALYDTQNKLGLDAESIQLIKIYYMQFVLSGANLSTEYKEKLSALNNQLAILQTSFQKKLLASANESKLILSDKTKLDGLSENEIASYAQTQGTGLTYVIPLQNTTGQPLLASLNNDETRKQLFNLSWTRSERGGLNDTRETIAKIAALRAEKAHLLGYPNFASYALADQMAETSQQAQDFLNQLVPKTGKKILTESQKIEALMQQTTTSKMQPWDWDYYSEKIRKIEFDVDNNELKPYFELDRVLKDGVFWAATQLYGITFKERFDIPVYHPDVRVFEVFEHDGSTLGLFYCDYFIRDTKNGGAWMSSFVQQSKLFGNKPVVYNVANFTKPAAGESALLSFDDVTTMFHEFGHALHWLLNNSTYPTLGSDIARDFVEFPSQFNENWSLYPSIINHYAVHNITGETIPPSLVQKIQNSRKFNQGFALGEILAASSLDMQWHSLSQQSDKLDVNTFEKQALEKTQTNFTNVPPRYRSSYFLHIWSNGYAAGYYAYLWTEMLSHDAYDWFLKNGELTRENGDRFRDMILSRGHSLNYSPMFKSFYGKDPDINPMLEARGL